MSIFTSKFKIKQQVFDIYGLLADDKLITPNKMAFIQEQNLFNKAVEIVFSVLVNYSTPVKKKLNALSLAKRLFQTAHPTMIENSVKLIPALVDIVKYTSMYKIEPSKYFLFRQNRIRYDPEDSDKYVRFTLQLIKQWSEYMQDCKQTNSPWIFAKNQCQKFGVEFPSYFAYFTMRDYVEFMTNWMRRKKRNSQFKDKLEIFNFLSNESAYNKNINFYRHSLSENSDIIVMQIYSILINHSAPIDLKSRALKCLRDLYQEANMMFLEKCQEIILPFLTYFVGLFTVHELPAEKYFERIEKRLGIEPSFSKVYVMEILQMVKQWDKYQQNKRSYEPLRIAIEKKSVLNAHNDKSIYNAADYKQFAQNAALGRHREPEYIVPVKNSNQFEQLDKKQLERQLYQKKNRETHLLQQIQELKRRLEDKSKSSDIRKIDSRIYFDRRQSNPEIFEDSNNQLELVNDSQSRVHYIRPQIPSSAYQLESKKFTSSKRALLDRQKKVIEEVEKKGVKSSKLMGYDRDQTPRGQRYDPKDSQRYLRSPFMEEQPRYIHSSGYRLSDVMKLRQSKSKK